MKLILLRSKFSTFKIKIEKCPKTEKTSKNMWKINARIEPTQINGLIMKLSRPAAIFFLVKAIP